MGIHIGMTKINENEASVTYQFDIKFEGEQKIDEQGQPYFDLETIYGYCTLNKKTEDVTLDANKTDPFFLYYKGFYARVGAKLIMILRSGKPFPQVTSYAC